MATLKQNPICHAVIPARFASLRLPGKPLLAETGRSLIQHAVENVGRATRVADCVAATDDIRILQAVRAFGGQAVMTSPEHRCGTDRIAEVVRRAEWPGDDLILNVQGDEPELNPAALDSLIEAMAADPTAAIGTLACPFPAAGPNSGPGSPADPNCVKVVIRRDGRALYFSRSLIPYPRSSRGAVDDPRRWLLHLGVYAFRAKTLLEITGGDKMSGGGLEAVESLEQLRWLEAGREVRVLVVEPQPPGIDTPEDYRAFVNRVRAQEAGGASGRQR